jgi:hypothetical protein
MTGERVEHAAAEVAETDDEHGGAKGVHPPYVDQAATVTSATCR